jgi:hypothetical protein
MAFSRRESLKSYIDLYVVLRCENFSGYFSNENSVQDG